VRMAEPFGRAVAVADHEQREAGAGRRIAHARQLALARIRVVVRKPTLAVPVT